MITFDYDERMPMGALKIVMENDNSKRMICQSRARAYAYREGYEAGKSGASMDRNPYSDADVSEAWESGWGDGRRAACAVG